MAVDMVGLNVVLEGHPTRKTVVSAVQAMNSLVLPAR